MKKILYYIWQLPQHIIALCIMAFIWCSIYVEKENKHIIIYNDILLGGLSLGKYIFLPENYSHLLCHEMGHSKQSRIFGPLYLIIIGIPSLLHNVVHRCFRHTSLKWDYYSFYTERIFMN